MPDASTLALGGDMHPTGIIHVAYIAVHIRQNISSYSVLLQLLATCVAMGWWWQGVLGKKSYMCMV